MHYRSKMASHRLDFISMAKSEEQSNYYQGSDESL